MKRIKAVMYGVGTMAKNYMVKFMVEKGINVVGGITKSHHVGEDLGLVCGLGYPLNVKISNDPDEVISNTQADIAVLTVTSLVPDMYDHIARCVKNGMNVITIAEEVLYPWETSRMLSGKLDHLAKINGVTITGSGYQDIYWANMITQLAGTCHKVKSIVGEARYNIDDYGPEVAKLHHVGRTKDEFNEKIKKDGLLPSFLRSCAELICADMGLTITGVTESCEPAIDEEDIKVKCLGITVPAGKLVGCTDICEIETQQGINIKTLMMAKCYKKGELDINKWKISGYPDTFIENYNPVTDVATCSTCVNRIPDVINAEPGLITCEKLDKLKYRAHPLHYYIKKR